jgi:hypothetical protein
MPVACRYVCFRPECQKDAEKQAALREFVDGGVKNADDAIKAKVLGKLQGLGVSFTGIDRRVIDALPPQVRAAATRCSRSSPAAACSPAARRSPRRWGGSGATRTSSWPSCAACGRRASR